jgi:hypothetical protein
MHAKGSVTIGGTVFGAVEADIELDNGDKYHFVGYYADAGAGVGVCPDAEGDFPGESHILGGCFMEVIQVPGGFGVAFNDFHGEIGQLGGVFEGAVIELGVGGGTWTSASAEERKLNVGDRLSVELEHEFVAEKGGDDLND